jgi:hypothetical protein
MWPLGGYVGYRGGLSRWPWATTPPYRDGTTHVGVQPTLLPAAALASIAPASDQGTDPSAPGASEVPRHEVDRVATRGAPFDRRSTLAAGPARRCYRWTRGQSTTSVRRSGQALVIRADGADVLVARGMAAVMSTEAASAAFKDDGLSCWLAIMTLKRGRRPRLRRLRPVVDGIGTCEQAREAYLRRWIAAERGRPLGTRRLRARDSADRSSASRRE